MRFFTSFFIALTAFLGLQAAAEEQTAPASEIQQSKTLNEGTLTLTKAKVIGQILNVEFVWTPPKMSDGSYKSVTSEAYQNEHFDYIDETTNRKVGLLRDEKGKYMVDPLPPGNSRVLVIGGGKPKTITLKFPAPPETSPTITIDFPGAGAFDSVPVSRR